MVRSGASMGTVSVSNVILDVYAALAISKKILRKTPIHTTELFQSNLVIYSIELFVS
jgi:hypothetical protein